MSVDTATIIQTPRGGIMLDDSEFADHTRQSSILQKLDYLGPWCANCGRKGKTCKAGSKDCRSRQLTRAFRGCSVKALNCSTLPAPPRSWLEAKGYAGQNWRDRNDLAQKYAYEVAVGKVEA